MSRQTVARAARSALKAAHFEVQENGAGTYTGSVTLPPNSLLYDVVVYNEVLWAAGTSASLEVGDGDDPDGYYTAVDLKATDLLAQESISFAAQGGVGGAYLTVGTNTHFSDVVYPSGGEITWTVVSQGAGTAGRTHIYVLYFEPDVNVNSLVVTQ